MWILKTADEAEAPFLFRILPGSIKTVGRAARADFIVDAALVSRVHCRLTAGATELEVIDLESTNGTFVNGERTDRATLKSTSRIDRNSVSRSPPGKSVRPIDPAKSVSPTKRTGSFPIARQTPPGQ